MTASCRLNSRRLPWRLSTSAVAGHHTELDRLQRAGETKLTSVVEAGAMAS